jgi:integrase
MTYPKTHQKYWESKLKNRSFKRKGGTEYSSPDFSVRISVGGKPEWFNLGTANKSAAANRAREIWMFAQSHSRDEVMHEFKKKCVTSRSVTTSPTVGDFLRVIEALRLIKPKTFTTYVRKFRRVVAGAMHIASPKSRFDYVGKGHEIWRRQVDSVKLEKLTSEKIMAWRADFLKQASTDPATSQSANATLTSLLRNSKTLFSTKYTKFLPFQLPHNPFEGVPVGSTTTRKYKSDVDFKTLAENAKKELYLPIPVSAESIHSERETVDKHQQFKILILGIACGLRRGEIDSLLWKNVDFDRNTISVVTTEFGATKTSTSERTIDVAPSIMEIFKKYRAVERGSFVIISDVTPRPGATYHHYRCNRHFKHLVQWLRVHGVTRRNAIHELRKEYGSRVCQEFGIYAASAALGHGNITTTAASYLDKKDKVFIEF